DARDDLGIGHARDAAVPADVGGNALERHHRHGARVLGDLRLLRGRDVHDHAALQHLGEAGLEGQRSRLLLVHRLAPDSSRLYRYNNRLSDQLFANLILARHAVNRYIVAMTMWSPRLESRKGPRYLAIVEALADDFAAGQLPHGTRLPTHRDLAESLGVTVGTVSRAYAEAARRGLVSGEVGRGTFVRGPVSETAGDDGDVCDLSQNHPPEPAARPQRAALVKALASLTANGDVGALLDYPAAGGGAADREAGAAWIARAGLRVSPDEVLVCTGSQHGLTIVLATLLEPGDVLLTESLTYAGLQPVAGLLRLRLRGLPIDAFGLRPDGLAKACREGGMKAVYLIPTLHNPTTAVMPEGRRREIADVARAHGLRIVEDDV